MSAPEPTGFDDTTFERLLALRVLQTDTNEVTKALSGVIARHAGLVEPGGRIDLANRERLASACECLARNLANLPTSISDFEMRLIRVSPEESRMRRAFHTAGHVVAASMFNYKIESVNLSVEPERLPAEDVVWGTAGTAMLFKAVPRPPDRYRIDLQPKAMQMAVILISGFWSEFFAAPHVVPLSFAADFAGARRLASLYADEGREAQWLAAADLKASRMVSDRWDAVNEIAITLTEGNSTPSSVVDRVRNHSADPPKNLSRP